MTGAYEQIIRDNLERLYRDLPGDLARALPAQRRGQRFVFPAFGRRCVIAPDGITLGDHPQTGPVGILISLYALHVENREMRLQPLRAFKELPDSMPYAGAFAARTEQTLVPHVARIAQAAARIEKTFGGHPPPAGTGGDFGFVLYPLPRIALCYIFYEADEDFPAAATCLYSNNADRFLPTDALADVGEYTSSRMLSLLHDPAARGKSTT